MIILMVSLLALTLIVFLLMSLVKKGLMKEGDEWSTRKAKKIGRLRYAICIPLLALMFLICLISGVRIVDQTEIGVVKTFGQISGTIDSGLNIVNPLTDSVTMVDLKVRKSERSFASYTKDAQPLSAGCEYQYEVVPTRAAEVIADYGSQEAMDEKLGNLIEERVKIVLARYSAMPLLENRANLSPEVTAEVEKLEEQFPVHFSSVIVRDLDFSDAFEASVEAKMTAEQNALKAEQDKKTAVIKAQQEKEVAALEAEALEMTRKALENMPEGWIQQQYIEKWDGKLPQIVTEGSGLMLAPDLNGDKAE